MKKFLSILTVLFMGVIVLISNPTYADNSNLNNEETLNPIIITDWDYEIYNGNGELVETGTLEKQREGEIIPYDSLKGITLSNGQIAVLYPKGSPNGFYLSKGATYRVAYDLNRVAWAECEVRERLGGSIYKTNRRTDWAAGGGIIPKQAFYVAWLTNTDADPFTIKEFSLITF